MYAIEFHTIIKNGKIDVPEEYWERLRQQTNNEPVRVILLASERIEPTGSVETDIIEHLLANPLHISNFSLLSRDEAHERS